MPEHAYSIFQTDWWLDATAKGHWDAVEVDEGDGVVARLPFTIEKLQGLRKLGQPALTQSLGPWIQDTNAKYTKALSREMRLYERLIEQLPEHDIFFQSFSPEVSNWLPFYWAGFTQTTRYTYTLDLTQSLAEIRAGLDRRNRSILKKAATHLIAEVSDDLDEMLRLNDLTFQRQGLTVPYSHEYVAAIDEAVKKNARRRIVIARDTQSGRPHAGIYMVDDDRKTYSLFSGADPELRGEGGVMVARWKAIELAKEVSSVLDLQGSMIRDIERRNRNYGAHQIPYMNVSRKGPRAQRADLIRAVSGIPYGVWSRVRETIKNR